MTERIIIVPGIAGSKIGKNGYLPCFPAQPFSTKSLTLTSIDHSDGYEPQGLLEEVLRMDFYRTLIKKLRRAGHHVDVCPYDWRYPVEDSDTVNRLRALIKQQPGNCVIIAHSMGGLVVKHCLLNHPESAKRVKYFFSVATPWLGSPDAYWVMRNGLGPSGWLGRRDDQANAAQSFPSVYQLTPSSVFHEQPADGDYIFNIDERFFLDYDQTKSELNRRSPDGGYYNQYNEAGVQSWVHKPFDPPIKHIAIVGTGQLTLNQIGLQGDGKTVVKQQLGAGDGTVPEMSASWARTWGAELTYVTANHRTICSDPAVWRWILYVLDSGDFKGTGDIPGVVKSPVPASGLVAEFHCPVDVLVTRDDLAFAGMLGDYVFNLSPDVSVTPIGDNGKRILLTADALTHALTFRGTRSGQMTVMVTKYQNGKAGVTREWRNVTVNKQAVGELRLPEGKEELWISLKGNALKLIPEGEYGSEMTSAAQTVPRLPKEGAKRIPSGLEPDSQGVRDWAERLNIWQAALERAVVRGVPLVDVLGPEVKSFRINGQIYDLQLPLPVLTHDAVATLDLDRGAQRTVRVTRQVSVQWISPVTNSRTRESGIRFRLHAQGGSVDVGQRVTAVLVDPSGSEKDLIIHQLNEPATYQVLFNLSGHGAGTYRMALKSMGLTIAEYDWAIL